ncbi:MAG: hypothetical protein AAF518_01180 [Spirochaetota bacterium]
MTRRLFNKFTSWVVAGIGLGTGLFLSYLFAVSVGTLNTFTSGSTVSSSQINDNFTKLKTAIETLSANETIACKYTTESSLPIPNGVEEKIVFDQKSYDTHSAYNTTTGDYTIPEAGIYSIKVFLQFMKHPVGPRRISIWVNGILVSYGSDLLASSNSVNWGICSIEDEFSLKKGDVVTIKAVQDSGAPLGLHNNKAHNRLLIRKVG